MSELEPGKRVGPALRLIAPLGAGAMGCVWIAEHITLDMQVAVKFMGCELANDPVSVARFSREAVAASRVKSPHVVQMLDHGVTDDGVPYIAMELLEGCDLARKLRERSPLSTVEVEAIVKQVALALDRAHARGVVHRDIKPENIFLCDVGGDEPFVKLLDFGIAKAAERSHLAMVKTRTGALMGSPCYMSPEQLLGADDVDFRTDLWALGAVAFEALTGKRPFQAGNLGELIARVGHAPLPSLSALRPSLPPELDTWFRRACARERDDRFASAGEMARALSAALSTTTHNRVAPWADTMVAIDDAFPLVRHPQHHDDPAAVHRAGRPHHRDDDAPHSHRVSWTRASDEWASPDVDEATFLPRRGRTIAAVVAGAVALVGAAAALLVPMHRKTAAIPARAEPTMPASASASPVAESSASAVVTTSAGVSPTVAATESASIAPIAPSASVAPPKVAPSTNKKWTSPPAVHVEPNAIEPTAPSSSTVAPSSSASSAPPAPSDTDNPYVE